MKECIKILLVLAIVGYLSLTVGAFAQGTDLTQSERVEFSKNILIPSPADLFVALDKMGTVNWLGAASFNKKFDYGTDAVRALNLGVRGADGFMAIQANNKEKLGEMIQTVIQLAEDLGASGTILDKRRMFETLTKYDKWPELRFELDNLQNDVRTELISKGDFNIALLFSTGGWLNGLRATTKILSESYDRNKTDILFQPSLVLFFETRFNELDTSTRNQPIVKKIEEAIPQIKALIPANPNAVVSEDAVKKLYAISSELVAAIEKG